MTDERLAGRATAAGTHRSAESFGAGARVLGRTGLSVTPIGFGGYRVTDGSAVHRRALADALRGGVNLIDTSTNYTDGGSERLIGRIIANLVQQGELRRDEVVVVSKVGYVQGDNLRRTKDRSEPYADVVQYGEQLWHCIDATFIADQVAESHARLGLSQIDVVLLHNPEYFLMDAARRGVAPAQARAEFDTRVRAAFMALEAKVADGSIGWYGVSSNGFVDAPDAASYTSVARMVEIATEVAGADHHFAVVQWPMNLLELGAVLGAGAPDGSTALEVAAKADLGVIVNRPLNAFARIGDGDRLVRLAAGGSESEPSAAAADEALAKVRKLEARWATGLGRQLVTEGGEDATGLFRWGRELSERVDGIGGLQHWTKLRHEVIAPHLAQTSSALLKALQGEVRDEFSQWWEAYGTAMYEVFTAIERRLTAERFAQGDEITGRLDPLLPEPWRSMPLSSKAVLALLGTPISSVLVGMRRPGYVAEMLVLRDTPVRVLSAAAGVVDLRAVGAAMADLPA